MKNVIDISQLFHKQVLILIQKNYYNSTFLLDPIASIIVIRAYIFFQTIQTVLNVLNYRYLLALLC